MLSPYQDTALNYLEGLGLMVSMMSLYLGVWTFSASGASQIFISVLIFILNGIWLLCVAGILFASFGGKARRAIDVMVKKCCGANRRGGEELDVFSSSLEIGRMQWRNEQVGMKSIGDSIGMEKQDDRVIIINPLMARK